MDLPATVVNEVRGDDLAVDVGTTECVNNRGIRGQEVPIQRVTARQVERRGVGKIPQHIRSPSRDGVLESSVTAR